MTVPTTVNRTVYLGAGLTGPFGTNFPFILNADVKCIKTLIATGVGTALAEGPDYTLVQDAVTLQGTVTLAVAIDATYKLTIYRDPAATQNTSWPPNDKFPAKTTENSIDRLTMLVQRFTDLFSRGARFADSDVSGADATLPTPVAGSLLGWSATGLALQNYISAGVFAITAFGQTLINAATAAAARILLDTPSNAEAILKTIVDAKGDLIAATAADTVGIVTIGAENSTLIADPAQAKGMQWVRLGAGATRQSVLAAALDVNGLNVAITTGAGLRPGLEANPIPIVMAFASGFSAIGAQDLTATLSADVADILGADAKLNNTTFLHATWVSLTGVTWGQCLVPPDYGYAFDRTRGALFNFEAADATTVMLDDFGNTWTAVGNAQIDTAQSKFGTASLLLDGTGDYIENTQITTLGDGSWEMSCWFRINALPGAGNDATFFSATNAAGFGLTLRLHNVAGTTTLIIYGSSDGATWDNMNAQLGANTVWALNQWNRVRVVFDALAGTYRVYLSLNGAAETQDATTTVSRRICTLTKFRLGVDSSANNGFNGWIDAFRFIRAATNTTTETPSAAAPTITDYPYHFFSIPEMKMYEVTAASGAAGTNPTLTQRNRLFNAEFDTSGAAVTAVRNYALRGAYMSAPTTGVGASTTVTFNHNLGVPREHLNVEALARNKQSPAQWAQVFGYSAAATRNDPIENYFSSVSTPARNTLVLKTSDGGVFFNGNNLTASYELLLRVTRSW